MGCPIYMWMHQFLGTLHKYVLLDKLMLGGLYVFEFSYMYITPQYYWCYSNINVKGWEPILSS